MDRRIERSIVLMESCFGGEVSLQTIATAVNLSPSRLAHLFKAETGYPPVRYLTLMRLRRAKDLLETSFLSVKEVRVKVGINDSSHFVRSFKRWYGVTPTALRKWGHRRPVQSAALVAPPRHGARKRVIA